MEDKGSFYSSGWMVWTTLSAQTVQQVIVESDTEDWMQNEIKHGNFQKKKWTGSMEMNAETRGNNQNFEEDKFFTRDIAGQTFSMLA